MRITPEATAARSQCTASAPLIVQKIDWFPPRETLLEPVPVVDRLLADVPAQQDLLSFVKRREVDESPIEVLHLDAQPGESRDTPFERRRVVVDLDLQLGEVARSQAAAVALDLRDEVRPLRRRRQLAPPVVDHLLGERPHLVERVVRFLGREIAGRHVGLPVVTSRARLQSRRGLGAVAEIFLWSRAAIWLGAIFAYLWFEPKPPPLQRPWDRPELHDV